MHTYHHNLHESHYLALLSDLVTTGYRSLTPAQYFYILPPIRLHGTWEVADNTRVLTPRLFQRKPQKIDEN